ncbi:hypothetical protein D3C86_1062830 [compost metagenome]
MAPAVIASATIRLGRAVLIPTQVDPTFTSSQVYLSLRAGSSRKLSRTGLSGASQPRMEPELAQWAVTTSPVSRRTSAKKRL